MNYHRSRRGRCGRLFLPKRTTTKVVVFLLFLVSLFAFYQRVVPPGVPKNVLSSKLWDNYESLRFIGEQHFQHKTSKSSRGFELSVVSATERNEILTATPRSLKNCLNNRQPVDFNFVGWTNFSLIMPHVEPNISCEERKLLIVVVVNSAADERHRILRMSIRKTWGYSAERKQRPENYKWRLYFALGMSSDYAMNLKNKQEAIEYNDVIIGDFPDTYKNIVIKTFMSHFWAYSRFDCMYVLKTDDDVYVRVSRLTKWLEKQRFPNSFYGGFLNQAPVVFRDPKSPWYISYEEFNETRWPPFSHGAFQVVSTAILPRCFNYTQFRRPFSTDDAYFGVMARDLGINATQIPGFHLARPETDGELVMATAFGNVMDASVMLKYHARYNKLIMI